MWIETKSHSFSIWIFHSFLSICLFLMSLNFLKSSNSPFPILHILNSFDLSLFLLLLTLPVSYSCFYYRCNMWRFFSSFEISYSRDGARINDLIFFVGYLMWGPTNGATCCALGFNFHRLWEFTIPSWLIKLEMTNNFISWFAIRRSQTNTLMIKSMLTLRKYVVSRIRLNKNMCMITYLIKWLLSLIYSQW